MAWIDPIKVFNALEKLDLMGTVNDNKYWTATYDSQSGRAVEEVDWKIDNLPDLDGKFKITSHTIELIQNLADHEDEHVTFDSSQATMPHVSIRPTFQTSGHILDPKLNLAFIVKGSFTANDGTVKQYRFDGHFPMISLTTLIPYIF
jgi:hypothetical protein